MGRIEIRDVEFHYAGGKINSMTVKYTLDGQEDIIDVELINGKVQVKTDMPLYFKQTKAKSVDVLNELIDKVMEWNNNDNRGCGKR